MNQNLKLSRLSESGYIKSIFLNNLNFWLSKYTNEKENWSESKSRVINIMKKLIYKKHNLILYEVLIIQIDYYTFVLLSHDVSINTNIYEMLDQRHFLGWGSIKCRDIVKFIKGQKVLCKHRIFRHSLYQLNSKVKHNYYSP